MIWWYALEMAMWRAMNDQKSICNRSSKWITVNLTLLWPRRRIYCWNYRSINRMQRSIKNIPSELTLYRKVVLPRKAFKAKYWKKTSKNRYTGDKFPIFSFLNIFEFRNEDLRILASDEFGVIPASTRLQVALSTVASTDKKVKHFPVCTWFCHPTEPNNLENLFNLGKIHFSFISN